LGQGDNPCPAEGAVLNAIGGALFGILLGSAFSAARLDEWKLYTKVPIKQCLWALFVGILKRLAAMMAPACNV